MLDWVVLTMSAVVTALIYRFWYLALGRTMLPEHPACAPFGDAWYNRLHGVTHHPAC